MSISFDLPIKDKKFSVNVTSANSTTTTPGPDTQDISSVINTADTRKFLLRTVLSEVTVTPPPPPPTTGYDKFGVLMKYPTKPNGETWFLDIPKLITNKDPQVIYSSSMRTTDLKDLGNGWFKFTKSSDEENRFNITTSAGYDHSKCVLDWNKLLTRGYMQDPRDWRNVEITAYVKLNSVYSTSGHSLVWYCRGGHHSRSYPCEGSAYKGNIKYTGDSRFQKELGHPAYQYTDNKKTALSGNIMGKKFGYKFCCYDMKDGNVKMENWLDLNLDNNWVKVDERIDVGGWGDDSRDGVDFHCGGPQGTKFMWGGPEAVFRFDSAKDFDFAKMSIREILVAS